MIIRNTCVVLLAGLVISCGSGNSGSSNPGFDGTYDLSSTSNTLLDVNGGTCGEASGTLIITESELGGSVLTTNGNVFDISGNISSDGEITGGFAQSGQNAATFDGSISGNRGSGTWSDIFECTGSWEATKKP